MPVFVVGANFRSAPLELLERLAIDHEHVHTLLPGSPRKCEQTARSARSEQFRGVVMTR